VRPSIESVPLVMLSSPAIIRKVVDLPQPEGPSRDHELAVLDGLRDLVHGRHEVASCA
jgi:hypothetical protein